MGIYINPTNERSKEQWLLEHAASQQSDPPDWRQSRDAGLVPVCLVNNIGLGFTAAAVAYCEEELQVFARPDSRPKTWFLVPVAALSEDSGLTERMISQIE